VRGLATEVAATGGEVRLRGLQGCPRCRRQGLALEPGGRHPAAAGMDREELSHAEPQRTRSRGEPRENDETPSQAIVTRRAETRRLYRGAPFAQRR
jgi:hypothetical protein